MKDNLTWTQIKDWWPLLVVAIALGGVFAQLQQIKENQIEQLTWQRSIESRYGQQALQINTLQERQLTLQHNQQELLNRLK